MRLDAIAKKNFTGEYWDYTSTQDPTGQVVREYFKVDDRRFNIVPGEKGTLYLYCDEQLRYNTEVRNLRDASGEIVFKDALSGNPQTAYVGISEPLFNIYGSIIGYRHDLSQAVF